EQTCPQPPQLNGSDWASMHVVPHRSCSDVHNDDGDPPPFSPGSTTSVSPRQATISATEATKNALCFVLIIFMLPSLPMPSSSNGPVDRRSSVARPRPRPYTRSCALSRSACPSCSGT